MSDSPPTEPATWRGWFSADPAEPSADEASAPTDDPTPDAGRTSGADRTSDADPSLDAGRAAGFALRLRRLIGSPSLARRTLSRVAAASRRWPTPDRVTYVLASLLVVLGGTVAVRYETRPQAQASVRSACTEGIASTGAVVHAATLRSASGTGGRWTVGVQVTDGAGTQEWICHVVWDGRHATILTAVPGVLPRSLSVPGVTGQG